MSIVRILVSLLSAYCVLLFFFYFFQSTLIFIPGRNPPLIPPRFKKQIEEVSIIAADGVRLHGWHVTGFSGKSGKTVLFCHGNAGNIGDREATIEIILSLGLNILIFDYRGYGISQGKPSEKGLYADVLAAYQYLLLEKALSATDIIVWGRSLGGPVAARLASEVPVSALIVESSFSSIPELGAELYPYLPVRFLARYQMNTRHYLQKRQSCPLLIIHSPDDKLIPFSHGQGNFQAAASPKSFLEIKGDHNSGFLVSETIYKEGIRNFLAGG
jgi:fermentation-respiration switch protein FrsA (DUF1100 family)